MRNEINLIIEAREKDIGITVGRVLPWAKKRMVGPFIFLDQMGPTELHASEAMDVRPHPHIGLSTLTYLFDGKIRHRDSLGFDQLIVPGEVNWMTAGKGISHSEREPQEVRNQDRLLHGLQFWVALPKDKEDMDPTFLHYDSSDIPKTQTHHHEVHIVAGGKSPLKAHSPMTFQVVRAKDKGFFSYEEKNFELAVYVVKGTVEIGGETFHEKQMIVFKEGSGLELTHSSDALFAVIGGVPFPEPRFIYWNFVSSSQEKIEVAKKAWSDGTFPGVPGDPERIPLPVS